MAFRASPQHSSSKLGSAFGLRLNSDLFICSKHYKGCDYFAKHSDKSKSGD